MSSRVCPGLIRSSAARPGLRPVPQLPGRRPLGVANRGRLPGSPKVLAAAERQTSMTQGPSRHHGSIIAMTSSPNGFTPGPGAQRVAELHVQTLDATGHAAGRRPVDLGHLGDRRTPGEIVLVRGQVRGGEVRIVGQSGRHLLHHAGRLERAARRSPPAGRSGRTASGTACRRPGAASSRPRRADRTGSGARPPGCRAGSGRAARPRRPGRCRWPVRAPAAGRRRARSRSVRVVGRTQCRPQRAVPRRRRLGRTSRCAGRCGLRRRQHEIGLRAGLDHLESCPRLRLDVGRIAPLRRLGRSAARSWLAAAPATTRAAGSGHADRGRAAPDRRTRASAPATPARARSHDRSTVVVPAPSCASPCRPRPTVGPWPGGTGNDRCPCRSAGPRSAASRSGRRDCRARSSPAVMAGRGSALGRPEHPTAHGPTTRGVGRWACGAPACVPPSSPDLRGPRRAGNRYASAATPAPRGCRYASAMPNGTAGTRRRRRSAPRRRAPLRCAAAGCTSRRVPSGPARRS